MPGQATHSAVQRVAVGFAAVVVCVLAMAGGVVLAIVSFGISPWAPAVVVFALVAGGVLLYRRTDDLVAKGLALGLVFGAILAVLLWPLFAVDTGTIEIEDATRPLG